MNQNYVSAIEIVAGLVDLLDMCQGGEPMPCKACPTGDGVVVNVNDTTEVRVACDGDTVWPVVALMIELQAKWSYRVDDGVDAMCRYTISERFNDGFMVESGGYMLSTKKAKAHCVNLITRMAMNDIEARQRKVSILAAKAD